MGWNSGQGWNIGPANVRIVASFSGLKLHKCANWDEDAAHGGDISANLVTTLWDFISDTQNQEGYTDFRKCHIKNTSVNSTGPCYIRPVLVMPDELMGRLSITIAAGMDYDDMSNKPDDEDFDIVMSANIGAGGYQPIWLKRTITAGGASPGYYTNIQIALTVSEVL